MCVFFEEKSALTECSPRASCYLEQKVRGSWILCCFTTLVLKRSLEWCALFWRKSALTECTPEPLAIWNKELEGLESEFFKELKTSPVAAPEHYSKRTQIHNLSIFSGSLLLSDVGSTAFRCICMVVVECKCLLFTGCTVLVYSPEYACCWVLFLHAWVPFHYWVLSFHCFLC